MFEHVAVQRPCADGSKRVESWNCFSNLRQVVCSQMTQDDVRPIGRGLENQPSSPSNLRGRIAQDMQDCRLKRQLRLRPRRNIDVDRLQGG